MSAIGNQLGAEVLMYGRLEKQGKQLSGHAQGSRRRPQGGRSSRRRDIIPLSEANGAALQGWAKKIYAKLTGETSARHVRRQAQQRRPRHDPHRRRGEGQRSRTAAARSSGLAEGKYRSPSSPKASAAGRRTSRSPPAARRHVPVELEKGARRQIGAESSVRGPGPGPGPGPGTPNGSSKSACGRACSSVRWSSRRSAAASRVASTTGAAARRSSARRQCSHGIANNGCTPTRLVGSTSTRKRRDNDRR